ncbi:S-layer homology domain-containing protein [Oscillibacter sp. PC13]|uniref:S-layer homology domain-containing protein n=1 Tax=Oscillibacter sp. PC13 TaxID=1855299 RepID=UPI0008E688D6|nr:S-layer homology domain-containing protein [Oscillibacter sp. PC13]SFP50608.1 S-layer homology domain-containing protein [Oscillibacter sp. PC13]
MKKFLSLVLALVMTMSLVTISAGAKDFTDNSKITYEEAVAVVSEIGVVDGYTDGSFNPQNNLTRGAAAKIICNLILGPTTASALSADTAPFKDVPATHEFAGYIAYCAQQGIISGYADGTFRPAAPLTGYAFLKMLLGGLGYDAQIEGFVGGNWSVQVAKTALGNKLTSGNDDFVGTKTVNREEACLYTFNTLKADMVEYDSKTSVNVNGAEVVIGNTKAQKIASEEAAGYDDTLNKDNLQFAEKYFPKLTRTKNYTDNFGRPAAEWKFKSTIIGTYADDSDLIATYTAKAKKGDLYSLVGSSTVKGIEDKDYDLTVYVDGDEVKTPAVADLFVKNSSGAAEGKSTKAPGVTGNGVLTEVYMDDDNNVTIVIINTYLAKATADYNSTKGTLSIESVATGEWVAPMGTTIDNDDVNVEEFKEDDYILVTYSYMSDAIESAVKAEVVTGEVSEYTVTDYVIMDGTTYKYDKMVGTGDHGKDVEYAIGEDAIVVLDAYGYILYVDNAVSTSNYVWIQDAAGASGLNKSAIAQAYFADGTADEISVAKVSFVTERDNDGKVTETATVKNGDCIEVLDELNGWYTFSKTSAGKYNLTNTKLITGGGFVDLDGEVQIVMSDRVRFLFNNGPKANDSTVMVVIDEDGDPTVYTGVKEIPDIYASGAVRVEWVENTSGYAKYVAVDLSDATTSSVDDQAVADYLMLLKPTPNKTVIADDTYYQYKVIIDGEETTKYVVDEIVDGNVRGDLYYNVKENSKGYITGAKKFGDKDTQIAWIDDIAMVGGTISYSDGTVTIVDEEGDAEMIISADTKTYLVIGKGVTELLKDPAADYETYLGISARALAGMVKGYKVDGNVFFNLDDDDSDVVTELYIYISDAVEVDADGNPVIPDEGGDEPETITITVKAIVNLGNGVTDTLDDTVIADLTAEDFVDGKYAVEAPDFDGYAPIIASKNVTYVEGTTSYEVSFTYTPVAGE